MDTNGYLLAWQPASQHGHALLLWTPFDPNIMKSYTPSWTLSLTPPPPKASHTIDSGYKHLFLFDLRLSMAVNLPLGGGGG